MRAKRRGMARLAPLLTTGAGRRAGPAWPRRRPEVVRGDTGTPVRAPLRRRGICAIIPQLATETRPRPMDAAV